MVCQQYDTISKFRFTIEVIYMLLFKYLMFEIKHWEGMFLVKFTLKCIYDTNIRSLGIDKFFIRIDYVFLNTIFMCHLSIFIMRKC